MGVRSLASIGVILLLFAATVFFALGERQSDRVTEPAPEAAIAPSEQQAPASHQTEPAPDAEQDRNAADPLAIPDRKQDPVLRTPAAALPEVVAEATGVANVDPATNSAAPDRTLAAVEPRRPPPLVELNNVALAQSRLNALGYRAGSVDGVVGPRTRAAIRRFQADAGLPVDGRISDPLIAALRRQSTKSNLQMQGREKPRRRIMPALRLQPDSVRRRRRFRSNAAKIGAPECSTEASASLTSVGTF
jgi:hypothetical protein